MSTPAKPALPGDPTRERLKTAAQRLIAERGIDGVSVRDIVAAANEAWETASFASAENDNEVWKEIFGPRFKTED